MVLIRMLGTLAVSRDGRAVGLPASRKVRALIAYLALTPSATPRTRLCELLFDSVNDARAEVRWCLSKARGIVGGARLRSDEDSVRFDLADCFVDALELQRAARTGFNRLPPGQVRELLTLFGGEFLEGLDDVNAEFSSWLLAQRRRFQEWRVALLQRLVECSPEAELIGHVEKWLGAAPFDVRAHEHLMRALVRRGRFRDGKEHLAASIKLFRAEGLDCAPLGRMWLAATADISLA